MRSFAGKYLLVLFYVIASVLECNALECYSCQNIGDVHVCNVTEQCNSGESCSMTSVSQGTGRFNMGCLENQNCGSASSAGSSMIPIGKRQTINCHECCSSNLCNSGLCSHLKPSACVDDERQDCAQLHSLLNICNDIAHAKLICPKFCKLCNVVDGKWTQWSHWTSCDVTCGTGTQTRTRTCTDPAPAHGGSDCVGTSTKHMQCTKDLCPVHGGWSRWSGWGSCSATCDIGLQRRDRSCSNPYPTRFGDNCYGDSRDDRICLEMVDGPNGEAGLHAVLLAVEECSQGQGHVPSRNRLFLDRIVLVMHSRHKRVAARDVHLLCQPSLSIIHTTTQAH